MSTPPKANAKTIGAKRKNDGGPANPTVMGRKEQIRNAINGAKGGKRKAPTVSLAPIRFGEKDP